ncbi:MAG: serine/threonine-protein kinase [Bryobacterales bacterium]
MVGRVISHYRVLEKLGEGGMGVVYKAEDLKLRREVALKFLRERDLGEDVRKRFFREAQAAAALQHPNICTIFEVDEVDGQVFFAMAFVEGRTLADVLAGGPLEVDEAVDIAIQLADALAAAHHRGVVHRDIKAGNVIVTEDGRAVVLDFGLAQMGGESRITRTGATVGTAAYMSPEQAQGADMDQRTDIWSLGVLLYEMIAGRRPFRGQYELAVMYNIVHEPPEPIREVVPDASPELEQVLDRALRKNAEERYQSARELARDLRALRGRYSSPDYSARDQPTVVGSAIKPRARSRSLTLGAVAVAVLALGGAAAWFGLQDRPASSLFAAIPSNKHLAVLPFENIGKQTSSQALCDGLVEDPHREADRVAAVRGWSDGCPGLGEVRAEASLARRAASCSGSTWRSRRSDATRERPLATRDQFG